MTRYTDVVRTQVTSYELLRADLQAFFDRVQDDDVSVSYVEAFGELSTAEQDRRQVRDVLSSVAVPEGMWAEHETLISVVNRAIVATQAGYDGISQADDCFEFCFYRDAPGYQRFQSESSAITAAYSAASEDWESTAVAVAASITSRELPAKPVV